jgi:hypothetical protein
VEAGGMKVQGGLSILSGGLSLPQQPFAVGSLHASAGEENLRHPLIAASAGSGLYSGDILALTAAAPVSHKQSPSHANHTSAAGSAVTADPQLMSFLNLQLASADGHGEAQSVFRIRGSGQIESSAGALFKGATGLEVQGPTALKGKVNLQRATITPAASVEGRWVAKIPITATYAVIAPVTRSTGDAGAVEVVFDREGADLGNAAGRVVLLSNADEQTTSGDAAVPPHSTVLMLYDGRNWVSVDALKAPMHVSSLRYRLLIHVYCLPLICTCYCDIHQKSSNVYNSQSSFAGHSHPLT